MNDSNREKQLAFLENYCAAHRDEDVLDDLVHDLKSKEAAEINNGGVSSQLDYLLEQLGATESARAVMGNSVQLPDFFQASAASSHERSWRVAYRICTSDGEAFHNGKVVVQASTEVEASKKAVLWALDNDPCCDARIDYHVQIEHAEETGDGDDDEQDDPAG